MPEVSRDLLKYFKGFCSTPSVIGSVASVKDE